MDHSRFVELSERERESLADLTCSICDKICIDAMRCTDDHFFCRQCIHTHLETSPTCPVDNKPLTSRDLLPSKLVERLISRLTVSCDNSIAPAIKFAIRSRLGRPTGCRWKGPYSDLKAHLLNCAFRTVYCEDCGLMDIPAIALQSHLRMCLDQEEPCRMCHARVSAREIIKHRRVCPDYNVICPNHCLVQPGVSTSVTLIRRRNLADHLKVCPKQMVKCEFGEWGCSYKGFKNMLGSHMARDLRVHVGYMRKEVKRLGEKMADVAGEVGHLRDLVNSFREGAKETTKLQEEVWQLRTEVNNLKRLLTEDNEQEGQVRRPKIRKVEHLAHSGAAHKRVREQPDPW